MLEFMITEEDEACEKEIDDAAEYKDKIVGAILSIEGELEAILEMGSNCSRSSLVPSYRSKENWKQFWKRVQKEPAKSVISGIPMTDAFYETAINPLKKRFANPSVIQRAHINQLLNLTPVFNEKNFSRLRSFHDQIETHFRGLEALNVDKITYSNIIVPVLMEKLPEVIRLGMIREAGRLHLEWNLEEMLKALSKEVGIRECHVPFLKASHAPGGRNDNGRIINNRPGIGTASALLTEGMEKKKCVYCRQEHPHEVPRSHHTRGA